MSQTQLSTKRKPLCFPRLRLDASSLRKTRGVLLLLSSTVALSCGSQSQPQSQPLGRGQPAVVSPSRAQAARSDVERIRAQVGVSSLGTSSVPTASPKTQQERGAAMLRRVKRRLSRLWYHTDRHGTVAALYSPQAAISVAGVTSKTTPEQAARRFFQMFPGLLGLDAADTLELTKATARGGGTMLHFSQRHAGLRCVGAGGAVAVEADGSVRGFLSSAMYTASLQATATFSSSAAGAAHAPDETLKAAPELVYVRKSSWTRPKLAWRYTTLDADGVEAEYWFDAAAGAQLRRESKAHALVPWGLSLTEDTTLLKNQTSCPGCALSFEQGKAWDHSEAVADWLYLRGIYSYNNDPIAPATMETSVFPGAAALARWTGTRLELKPNHADNPEIVAHEWGHALAAHIGFTHSHSESEAISEGFADCFGLAVPGPPPQDWVFGNAGTAPLATPRDPQLVLTEGGFRNFQHPVSGHEAAHIVSHICYLAGFSSQLANPPFPWDPTPCTSNNDCPDETVAGRPGFCLNQSCVSWSNAVPVPYLGREEGYLAILWSLLSPTGFFPGTPTFENLVMALTFAGCEYDFLRGFPLCQGAGATLNLASFAAGFWRIPTRLQDPTATTLQTAHRPANVADARDDPAVVWHAEVYNNSQTGTLYSSYQNWAAVEAPGALTVRGRSVPTQFGVSALRSATGMGWDASLFHVNPSGREVNAVQGDRAVNGDVVWSNTLALTNSYTNATPSAVDTGASTLVFWRRVETNEIYCTDASQAPGTHYLIPNSTSVSAPTAVVAEGYTWLFFLSDDSLGTDKYRVYVARRSTAAGCIEWSAAEPLGEDLLHGVSVLEAHHYQPAAGDGRIWLFFNRTQDAGSPVPDYGTRMWSFDPGTGGSIPPAALLKPPVYLEHTRALTPATGPVFYSTYQTWDGFFYMDHTQDGTIWRTVKLGEG